MGRPALPASGTRLLCVSRQRQHLLRERVHRGARLGGHLLQQVVMLNAAHHLGGHRLLHPGAGHLS